MRLLPFTLVLTGALATAACTATTPPATSTAAAPSSAASSPAGSPAAVPVKWPLPADPSAAAATAGLQMLGEEKVDVHYHAHVDVIVRGVTIPVPADIGIDMRKQAITALHTHDGTGIVHIESAKDVPFTLGQLFAEWGQPLTATQAGPVAAGADEQVRVYRNGTLVAGDPAAVVFAAHDEIVVWLGKASETPAVPAGYTFSGGL